ncbi:MAG: hypothetical protein ABW110_02945, partial [Steroidobacteraceae bacterium]
MTAESLGAETMSKETVKHHILKAVRRALEQDIVNQLHSEDGVSTIHLIIRLLDFLGEDAIVSPASLAGRSGLPGELLDELNALVARPSNAPLNTTDLAAIGNALSSVLERADRSSNHQPEA